MTREEMVKELLDSITPVNKTRNTLTEEYAYLRATKDALAKEAKEVQAKLDKIEQQLVLVMENESLTSFKDERYGTVYLRDEVRASVKDESALFPWLQERNLDDVIKKTIHAKTLSSMVKDYPDMPGVEIFYQTKLGLRK